MKMYLAILYMWLQGLFRGYSIENIYTLARQCQVETSWGKNPLFLQYNNCFGMRVPSWSTNVVGEALNHAHYRTLWGSVADRITWDERNGINKRATPEQYLQQVQSKGYAESSNYIETVLGVRSIESTVTTIGLLIPTVVYLVWIFRK